MMENVAEMYTMNTNATKGWKFDLKYTLFMKIWTEGKNCILEWLQGQTY